MCRSRRELSNEYLLAKFGFDTAENEPCKVCPLSAYRSPRFDIKTVRPEDVPEKEKEYSDEYECRSGYENENEFENEYRYCSSVNKMSKSLS